MILPTERFEYMKVNKSDDENTIIFEEKFENGSFMTKELIPTSNFYYQILSEFHNLQTIFTTTAIVFALILLIFFYAIYRLIFIYRKSLYVPFLVTMLILDSILICVVIFDNLVFIQFKHMCCIKYMVLNFSYVANLWLMAGMYFQRYICVYYPMLKYHQKGIRRYLSDTRILICIALIFGTIHMINSAPKNCSAPMIVFDETVYSCNNAQNHLRTLTDYCRYAICNFLSYITPVAIDIILNICVIVYKPDGKKFSRVTAGSHLEKTENNNSSAYKIEPREQYKAAQKRRHKRIITCATVVTLQLILYIPILVCAFILTFMHLNETPYIAAIAFFLQYPYKLIVAHILCKDYEPKSKKSKEQTAAEITLVTNNNNS